MTLSRILKKILIWITAYLHLVAFVITGGFFFMKDDDAHIKATVKEALYFTFLFFFVNLVNNLISEFFFLAGGVPYGFSIYLSIVNVLKIITFTTLLILDLLDINLIHTPIGIRVQSDKVVIPSITEEEFLSEDEEEYLDEDGNVYSNNIFGQDIEE